MNEESLIPRVGNLEQLIHYMAQTQRDVTANQELLSQILQKQNERLDKQDEEIQLLRQIIQRHDRDIPIMQGQIRVLLERLLGNL
jgi:tRNA C32,U32 (ribose-2'-O)-methylase TrmJ